MITIAAITAKAIKPKMTNAMINPTLLPASGEPFGSTVAVALVDVPLVGVAIVVAGGGGLLATGELVAIGA